MYTEEKPRRGHLLKEFIMKLILIIIFVLLLIWLVPWPNMDSYINALNPLKDQIFNSNLQTMKEAGITYFTSERLPKEVGDKTTLTLQQMLDMKLLIPFTDRNGNSCDVTKSYITLEKKETEYVMKVNLKCGEEEDYILVHLGCYSYCTTDICEARPDKTEKPSTTPKQKSNDNVVPTTKPTNTPTVKPTITPTVKPTSDPTVTPTVKPTYKCKFINGEYWGKDYKVVDQKTYEDQCVSKPTPTPVVNKEYEYKKETSTYYAKEYSNWSNWTEYSLNEGQSLPSSTDLKQVEDLGYVKTKVGRKDAVIDSVVVLKPYQEQLTTAKYTVCKEKEYVIETKTTVTYTTTHTETITTPGYTITEGGQQLVQVNGNWVTQNNWYRGYNPPQDTASSRWVFQGVDFAQCGSNCTNHPYVVYREQKRDTTTYTIDGESTKTSTGGGSSSSSATSSNTSVSERIIASGCSQLEEREVPVYVTRVKAETKRVVISPAEDIYAYVHKYRVRTRTLLRDERTDVKIDYKWSSYNDTKLINTGYVYTGKTRTVEK